MSKTLIVNIHHNSLHSKDVVALYLYHRLRFAAADTGGYIKDFNYTKNEKYNVLPRLISNGWVSEDGKKVLSYQKSYIKDKCSKVYAVINQENLSSLDAFKGWVLASAEAYSISKKEKITLAKLKTKDSDSGSVVDVDWKSLGFSGDKSSMFETKKIKQKDGSEQTQARVFNKELTKLTGLSDSTITSWRKHSSNEYQYNIVSLSGIGRQQRMFADRIPKKSYYKNNKGSMLTKDLHVTTSIVITTPKFEY